MQIVIDAKSKKRQCRRNGEMISQVKSISSSDASIHKVNVIEAQFGKWFIAGWEEREFYDNRPAREIRFSGGSPKYAKRS